MGAANLQFFFFWLIHINNIFFFVATAKNRIDMFLGFFAH